VDGIPSLIRGDIDLLFREEDGWVLADYKTDRITVDDLAETVERYRDQVLRYALAWRKITGERVKECCLFFTALKRAETIDLPD
jgi:ATP-dependent helicase/nuclease subunit A